MFRFHRAFCMALRFIPTRGVRSDPLLKNLKNCKNEYQVFQLVGMNRSKLNTDQVRCAINMICHIQNESSHVCLPLKEVQSHPEFRALCTLAESQVSCMDDNDMVDTLYSIHRLNVEDQPLLVQKMVYEGWKRLERFNSSSLSKLAVFLSKNGLNSSPLLGQIATIVDKELDNVEDLSAIYNLIVGLQSVCSQSLQQRMLAKAESLLAHADLIHINTFGRIMHFVSKNVGYCKPWIWEKMTSLIMQNFTDLKLSTLCPLFHVYKNLYCKHIEVQVMIKSRLLELLEQPNNDTSEIVRAVYILLPIVSQETRNRLQNIALDIIDEIDVLHLPAVLKAIAISRSVDSILVHRVCSRIQKHLDCYTPENLNTIAKLLKQLPARNYELFSILQKHMTRNVRKSFITNEIALMVEALFLMKTSGFEKYIIDKLDAIVPQCNLLQVYQIARSIQYHIIKKPAEESYGNLYHKLNKQALAKIRNVKNIDDFLEVKSIMTTLWYRNVLMEATLEACQLLLHQVTYRNAEYFASLTLFSGTLCSQILDKVAGETIENISEISPTTLFLILRPFSYLHYKPANEEFYNVCLQHCLSNLESFRPRKLVELGYLFALAEHFPEDLLKAIFNVDFLRRLDLELGVSIPEQRVKTWKDLMKLNRAVCLECPELGIPWFHEQYCQQLNKKGIESENVKIEHLLGEALGGTHYTRMSVITPYGYHIDFEYVLDENKNPISYADLKMGSADGAEVQSRAGSKMEKDLSLPPGAKRVALNFMKEWEFCVNSFHYKAPALMKKRHLEILGYSALQIPWHEWNTMELGTEETWINYLKKKILSDEC